MLPLWRDRLLVIISPDRLVLERISGRLRPKRTIKKIQLVNNATNNWQPALHALDEIMRANAQWQTLDVSVLLSNHFVRYQLLPWSTAITNAHEQSAYARACFSQVYGEHAAAWVYAISPSRYAQAWLSSAIDQALLVQLEETIQQTQSRLVALTPHLTPAYQQLRRITTAKNLWFVQVEKHKLVLLLIIANHWQIISSHLIGTEQWQHTLTQLLEREWRLHGTGILPRKVIIANDETQPMPVDAAGLWQFEPMPPLLRQGFNSLFTHSETA